MWQQQSLARKTARMHWPLIAIITLLAATGFVLLYDAAGGSFSPYAFRQMVRFGLGLGLLWLIAMVDVRVWYRQAYVLYGLSLVLLVAVDVAGRTGMGATRWLDLKFFMLQPSEVAKVTLFLALARFYHSRPQVSVNTLRNLFVVSVLIALPMALVVIQPDLGTALVLAFVGIGVMFAAGVSWKLFAGGAIAAMAALPLAWQFLLHDYQRRRLLVFLNPEEDPLGAGYHILQSKIALGSAGFWGKGFMGGTQSHLMFLPEKHTDFIFTLLTEDFGLVGALAVIVAYVSVLAMGLLIAVRAHSRFAQLVAIGGVLMVFFHAVINMAMVMGLMPVVGIPLPFLSYGGTSLMTMLIAVGLMINAHVHRDVVLAGAPGLNPERVILGERRVW